MNNVIIKQESKSNKLLDFIIIVSIPLILVLIVVFSLNKIKYDAIKAKQKIFYKGAKNYCESLYEDGRLSDQVKLNDLDECDYRISFIQSEKVKELFLTRNNESKIYLELKEDIDGYYVDSKVTSSITLDRINEFNSELANVSDKYKEDLRIKIGELLDEYNNMLKAKEKMKVVIDLDSSKVKDNFSRSDYNAAVKIVNDLNQQDLKEEYEVYLVKAEKYLDEKEERLRREEAERQVRDEAIRNAWVTLSVPYVSQNYSGYHNACEAASLLMALKYKGYIINMDLPTFAENMPKSNDPNTGFYLSIKDRDPYEIAHWIAPEPLVNYGISTSGNNNIINASGYSLDTLTEEIINGNPVVIYLTYLFNEPYNWSNGVPKNLHVMLLTGYNSVSHTYLITDPWTKADGSYTYYLSKNRIEYLYNKKKKKAVIVR